MMKMILAFAFMLSASAQAAQDLVIYRHSAGFSPRPGWEQLTVQDDGKVRFHSEYRNRATGKKDVTSKLIAKLSKERTEALLASLKLIRENDLKDKNANSPRCTDAPSSSISVTGDIEIYRRASCHTWINEEQAAVSIKALIDGLLALTNI